MTRRKDVTLRVPDPQACAEWDVRIPSCDVLGPLAVHRAFIFVDWQGNVQFLHGIWTITHLLSGRAVYIGLPSHKVARYVARRLLTLKDVDWSADANTVKQAVCNVFGSPEAFYEWVEQVRQEAFTPTK